VDTYDIVMLVVLLAATLFGAWKGFAWQVAATASVVLSYFVAYKFRDALAPQLPIDAPLNVFAAMLILYAATSLAVWMMFRYVSKVINNVKLKDFDRQIGAMLGLGTGIALCLVITFFSLTLLGESHRQNIVDSRSGLYITKVIDKVHGVMPEEIHDVIGPYLHSLDDKLNEDSRTPSPRVRLSIEEPDQSTGNSKPGDLGRRGQGGASGSNQPADSNGTNPNFKIRFGDRDYGINLGFGEGEK
jgi:membrane protein required for colicin V production